MKYALHASIHKPARRPDQTASGLVGDTSASNTAPPEPQAPLAQGTEVPEPLPPPPRPSFLPPQPTLGRNAKGKPAFLAPPPTMITSAHDRPTLRFPAVPPPPPLLDSELQDVPPSKAETKPTPVIDVNEPTLEEKPVTVPMAAVSLDDLDEDVREMVERAQNATRIAMAPTAEAPNAQASSAGLGGVSPLRARKKGTPPPPNRELHHEIPPIDPAAWLADEAHARSSDRRDSADGVDPSDTVVPVPKPHHTSV